MKTLFTTLSVLLFTVCSATANDARPFAISGEPPNATSMPSVAPAARESKPTPARRTQWLMFTAAWCPPCQAARHDFEPWLRRSGWIIDDTSQAHIRLIDGDQQPALVAAHRITSYPTFVLLHDGRELHRHQGYPGRTELVRRYDEAVKATPPNVGAISVGTVTGQRDNIAKLIEILRPLLGTDGTVTITLDRTGSSPAYIPLTDRLSFRSDNPLVATYRLRNDVLTCRFAEPYPRGRFTYGIPLEQAVSAVMMSVSEVVVELPHAPDIRLKVLP